MATKWQRVSFDIPEDFNPAMRQALGLAIAERIRVRTQDRNIDKRGKRFKGYSQAYKESLDFKIAGKSPGKVDLTLSGDMMAALDVLSHSPGKIRVGYERGSEENAKADGNIRGTYGKPRQVGPQRDFLGLPKGDLNDLIRTVRREFR